MHVYLKNGAKYKWLVVHLVEGHSPRIAGISNCETEEITKNLEPGIWFKLMVVESVSVDCERRIVLWRTAPTEKHDDEVPVMTHSIYGDGDQCYDFDDNIDELFSWTKYLIEKNPSASEQTDAERKECMKEYEQCLFRLLHCYILSKIPLQPEDYNRLVNAHTKQLHTIKQLEDAASKHSKMAEYYKEQMREIRENKLLPDLSLLLNERQCSREFYTIFDDDLCKAIAKIQTEMVLTQSDVDQEKKNPDIPQDTNDKLIAARSRRDAVHEKLHLHLYAREHVRLALENYKTTHTINGPLSLACHEYVKLYQQCQEEKKISHSKCTKKLLAASVRECIKLSLDDLKHGVATCGDEMTTDGQRTTNVMLNDSASAEWQTLSERVASHVHDYESIIGKQFLEFTTAAHTQCANVLERFKVFEGKLNDIINLDDFDIVTEQDLGVNKEFLEKQKMSIEVHLGMMTGLLSQLFNSKDIMFTRKIQLCYEKCFFKEIGTELQLLYRTVYGRSMISLEHHAKAIQNLPVYKLGLEMNDEWWLALFEPRSTNSTSDDDEWSKDSDSCHGDDEEESSDGMLYCNTRRESFSSSWPGMKSRVSYMKEGLQCSTKKVLSRSKSNVDKSDIRSSGLDILKANSSVMAEEIDQRALNSKLRCDKSSLEIITCQVKRESVSADGVLSALGRKKKKRKCRKPTDTFNKHFGDALIAMRETFNVTSPLNKMQCLTNVLRKVSSTVEELRMRGKKSSGNNDISVAVTAEDLLPLIVLMLLKLTPKEIGLLYVEVVYAFDLMADFLTLGCHSYALTEFQTAFRVLDQTYEEMFTSAIL